MRASCLVGTQEPSPMGEQRTRYDRRMDSTSTTEAAPAPQLRERSEIADRFKWNLGDIFAGWPEWQRAYDELEGRSPPMPPFRAPSLTAADGFSWQCSSLTTSGSSPIRCGISPP